MGKQILYREVKGLKNKLSWKKLSAYMAFLLIFSISMPFFRVSANENSVATEEETEHFTDEELAYISNLGTLKVAYIADDIPVSYEDKKTGEFTGISRAIFDKIAEVSGLSFEYVALPSGSIEYDNLQEEGFDLITGVKYNEVNIHSNGMLLSNPYLSDRRVMVCREGLEFDKTANHTVAVATGSVTFASVVHEEYPNFELVTYDTVCESFEAVYKGEQDLLLANRYVAEYWIAKPKYNDLTVIPVEVMDESLCFSAVVDFDGDGGVSQADGEMIINIINKSLEIISEDELDNIIVKVTMESQYSYTFFDFIYVARYTIAISVFLIIIVIIVLANMSRLKKKSEEARRKEEKTLILQQKRYKMIIDNSDELIYEISVNGETCIASEKIKEKFGWEIPARVDNLSIKTLSDILHVHPDDEEQFYSSTEGLVANKETKELVIRLGKTDRKYIWCKVIYLPIIDDDNVMVSIVGKIVDVDTEVREKLRLEHKSRTDSLTGLLNKRTFEDEVREYIQKNTSMDTAYIFIDMDFFKNINDILGHITGDRVILDTAAKLQVIFANCDLVARFGGDEFCVFVKDIPPETLADKLKFAIEKLSDVYANNGAKVSLTASIGAAYCSSKNVSYEELLDCADKAVYTAKENGRNQFVISYL